jgi:hypothetical protein
MKFEEVRIFARENTGLNKIVDDLFNDILINPNRVKQMNDYRKKLEYIFYENQLFFNDELQNQYYHIYTGIYSAILLDELDK